MRFLTLSPEAAEGAILAHRLVADGLVMAKGERLDRARIERLRQAGVREIVAVLLEPGDTHEDEAAERLARALLSEGLVTDRPGTGRCSLYASAAGLLLVDREGVDAVNAVHEGITLATPLPFAALAAGDMAATIKIVPFAVPSSALARAEAVAAERKPLRLAPFRPFSARLIQTILPGTAEKVLEKTTAVTRERLAAMGGRLLADDRCPHEVDAVAASIAAAAAEGFDMLLVVGASATADRGDVVPSAILRAGGKILRFGMPVDPGNLLLIAELAGRPVLALPGSARSPKESGVDIVMRRYAAGIPPSPEDIARMGVGGLLSEIPSRPQPRQLRPRPGQERRIAALVLAAGRSTRMGGENKLLLEVGGKAMVRRVVEALAASPARPIVVVTGHERERIEAALVGLPVTFVHNPAYCEGLSTSLRAGIEALPEDCDGTLVCLGDMPRLTAPLIERLLGAFAPERGQSIVVPTCGGRRGNPVLFGRAFFDEMKRIAGDVGARHILLAYPEAVVEVETGDPAVLVDVDTPEAFAQLREQEP
ncbi:Molybdenum cofactor cytidylyltransferase [bacterium HR40]|nr:Molybdenum cofactor cytidylyltransferase [bacterium HR40]